MPAVADPPSYVTLKLSNINEAPYFDVGALAFEILETTCADETYWKHDGKQILPAKAKSIVGSISANEVDRGQESFLTLVTENTPFAIANKLDEGGGKTTWDIIVDKEVDFEAAAAGAFSTEKVWTLDFKVSDGQLSAIKQVKVTVMDCNERPTLVLDSKLRSVPENANGQAVTGDPFLVFDLDTSDGKIFDVVGGNGEQFFTINESGVLLTKSDANLDYEIESGYYVEIQVTDNPALTLTSIGDFAKSDTVTFKIVVTNVNEAPGLADHDFIITER